MKSHSLDCYWFYVLYNGYCVTILKMSNISIAKNKKDYASSIATLSALYLRNILTAR